MDKHAQYSTHAVYTQNGWVRTSDATTKHVNTGMEILTGLVYVAGFVFAAALVYFIIGLF